MYVLVLPMINVRKIINNLFNSLISKRGYSRSNAGYNTYYEEIEDNLILFQGDIDLNGNSRVYFEYLYKNYKDKYNFIWLLQNKEIKHSLPNDVKIIYDTDVNYKNTANKAKYVVISSAHLFNKTPKQVGIVLWHGMGFKTIGYTENNPPPYYEAFINDHFFVTSDFFKLITSARFRPNFNNIHITGLPRNDLIIQSNKDKNCLSEITKVNIDSFDKIILYAPTFKNSTKWNNKSDISLNMSNYFYFDDFNEKKLNDYFNENNVLMIVKPHWADENTYNTYQNKSNIIFLYDRDFVKYNVHLYDFFKFVDVLITDYSSIYIDYLLLKKPVIFVHSTKDSYLHTRGLIFNDNIDYFMPGDKVINQKQLICSIERVINSNVSSTDFDEKISLFHKYFDSNSCRRVYKIMKDL